MKYAVVYERTPNHYSADLPVVLLRDALKLTSSVIFVAPSPFISKACVVRINRFLHRRAG